MSFIFAELTVSWLLLLLLLLPPFVVVVVLRCRKTPKRYWNWTWANFNTDAQPLWGSQAVSVAVDASSDATRRHCCCCFRLSRKVLVLVRQNKYVETATTTTIREQSWRLITKQMPCRRTTWKVYAIRGYASSKATTAATPSCTFPKFCFV